MADRPLSIKEEPVDTALYFECEDAYDFSTTFYEGSEPLCLPLDVRLPANKHAASPAQEATRARIGTFEAQLRRLYRLRSQGKLDPKGAYQIRCLEEDLRKAHAKLRRLLNEAERQRRRRERLRSGSADAGMPFGGRRRQGYRHLPPQPPLISLDSQSPPDDRSIMSALRSCAKFEDFVRELRAQGFSLARIGTAPPTYDLLEDSEEGIDGDEVQVQVELIEGDSIIEQPPIGDSENGPDSADPEIIKDEPPSSPTPSFSPFSDAFRNDRRTTASKDPVGHKGNNINRLKIFADEYARKHSMYMREWQDQYQDWYERQIESQQHWEETFMREQTELAKSMLESVTTTFLQGMQQVLQNVVTNAGRRITPFCPNMSRTFDLSHLNQQDLPTYAESRSSTVNGDIFVSADGKAEGMSEQ